MKIIFATTPAPSHVNPMLSIAHTLVADGHEVVAFTGNDFRDLIDDIGVGFRPIPASSGQDVVDPFAKYAELKTLPPGLELLRACYELSFVDRVPAQHEGLQEVLREVKSDVVIGDDRFLGLLPMLLGPRSKRPPIVCFGTSVLHLPREDMAPDFLGLPPGKREQYAGMAEDHERIVLEPVFRNLNLCLRGLGRGPLWTPPFEAMVEFADAYLQLTVPSFEYPRPELPNSVRFVGTPPIPPIQEPLPPWASELDGKRKVVLVSQGTVANHDFSLLLTPTLTALANEPDLLVVAITGGRRVEALPGPIPDNVRVASYLPLEWILSKADVFVTNGCYGGVNQAMSFGVPLVCAGLTEDKADVNARVGWSGVGINLATNTPTPQMLHQAVRKVLETDDYRRRASAIAEEFQLIDTRREILNAVRWVTQSPTDRFPDTQVAGK